MASERKVPFHVSGEIPESKVEELVATMSALGVRAHFADLDPVDPVSPSILIEYVQGTNGLLVPVVTEKAIEEFLVSEEGEEHGSKTNAMTFMRTIDWHVSHDHAFRKDGGNYWGRECNQCDCPLNIVVEQVRHEQFIAGMDPNSIIEFAKLPFEEASAKINAAAQDFRRLGRGRYKLVQRIAKRLQDDLSA